MACMFFSLNAFVQVSFFPGKWWKRQSILISRLNSDHCKIGFDLTSEISTLETSLIFYSSEVIYNLIKKPKTGESYICIHLCLALLPFSPCLKGALSGLRQFLATENPLKIMKNALYFSLKALSVLNIFKLLS